PGFVNCVTLLVPGTRGMSQGPTRCCGLCDQPFTRAQEVLQGPAGKMTVSLSQNGRPGQKRTRCHTPGYDKRGRSATGAVLGQPAALPRGSGSGGGEARLGGSAGRKTAVRHFGAFNGARQNRYRPRPTPGADPSVAVASAVRCRSDYHFSANGRASTSKLH